jgi:hypothetical protein
MLAERFEALGHTFPTSSKGSSKGRSSITALTEVSGRLPNVGLAPKLSDTAFMQRFCSTATGSGRNILALSAKCYVATFKGTMIAGAVIGSLAPLLLHKGTGPPRVSVAWGSYISPRCKIESTCNLMGT